MIVCYVDSRLGERASFTIGDIVFTAVDPGVAGNLITVDIDDPAGNDVTLAVAVAGTAISITLATDGSSTPTSTVQNVIDAVNNDSNAAALVEATLKEGGNASGLVADSGGAKQLGGGTEADDSEPAAAIASPSDGEAFAIESGKSQVKVVFVDGSTTNPTAWDWKCNGITFSTQKVASRYFSVGTYSITMTASNAHGSDTVGPITIAAYREDA